MIALALLLATVTGNPPPAVYACNGTTVFTIPFPYIATSQVVATQTTTAGVATTVFGTVKPSTAPSTGTLTLGTACPSGSTLTISRSVPFTQPQPFRTGSYSGATHEQTFDRLEMQIQQLNAKEVADLGVVNNTVAAFNASGAAIGSTTSVLATGETTPLTLAARFANVVNVKGSGAKGDGVTDDTAALDTAAALAQATGRTLYLPIGQYNRSTPWQLKMGQRVIGENRYGNSHVSGATGDATNFQCDGTSATVIRNTVGGTVIEVADTSSVPRDLEIAHLCLEGPATDATGHTVGAGHGIYIHPNINVSGVNLHDLWIVSVGGKGIYITTQFNTNITNVDVHNSGDHAFDLLGGNTTLLVRDYAHWVGAYSTGTPYYPAGFRIHGGTPTLISCNGLDAGKFWGVFGDTVGEDGIARTSLPTLIGCNVEEAGLRLKTNSAAALRSNMFQTSITPNVTAIQADSAVAAGGMEIDSSNLFQTGGTGTWANGSPVHVGADGSIYAKGTVSGWYEGAALGHRYYDGSTLVTASNIVVGNNAAIGPTTQTYFGGLRLSGVLTSGVRGTTVLGGGTAYTPSAGQQNISDVGVSDGVAFTINAPTNPTTGQFITICLRNTSAGAMGAVTWNAVYKMSAWTNPASGFGRCIEFFYNGTNWKQTFQSAADVPN